MSYFSFLPLMFTVWMILPPMQAISAMQPDVSPLQLSLTQAVRMGLSNNKSLSASQLVTEGDRYLVDAANVDFHFKAIPSLSVFKTSAQNLSVDSGTLQSSAGIQFRKKFDIGTEISAEPTFYRAIASTADASVLNLTARQPLLRGFGYDVNIDRVRRAEFAFTSSKQGFAQTRINTATEIITAFYEALKQKQIAEINRALAERLRQHVLLISKKEKQGLTGPMDTYRAVIRSKDAEESVARSENLYFTNLGKLRWLLDLSRQANIELLPEKIPELEFMKPDEDARKGNIELMQLRAERGEAARSIHVAYDATLPDVSLQTSYSAPLTGSMPSSQQRWSITLQGSSDLFRGEEKSNLERAKIRAEALEITLQYKTNDIDRQVEQSLLFLKAAKERIDLRNTQIKEAEGKLALAKVKFAHDMTDNFELIETESVLQRAQIGLLETKMDYALSIYNLRAISGHLLDTFQISDKEPKE